MHLIRKLLFPFSFAYGVIVSLRNWLYDIQVFKSKDFDIPIICVGNLSVGGTGKSPMIEYLLSILMPKYKVAVLSRGYKRKSTGFVLASKTSTVEDLGDEPFQIYKKHPSVILVLEANRVVGIENLIKLEKPDIILLDDAFQHRKVKAGLNILLTTYDNLYVEDFYLPTGNLRDSKRQAKRADIIVVTKCPPAIVKVKKQQIIEKLKPTSTQKVLFSSIHYDSYVQSEEEKVTLDDFIKMPFVLVTGIANPRPLVDYLKGLGAKFTHNIFADHHLFTDSEIIELSKAERILTTEKDAVRLFGKLSNVYSLGIKHDFGEDTAAITQDVLEYAKEGYFKT